MQNVIAAALDAQRESIVAFNRLLLPHVLAPYRGHLHDVFDYIHQYLTLAGLVVKDLSLQANDITRLPDNFYLLSAHLTVLNLLDNEISSIPDSLVSPTFQVVDMSNNKLTHLPSSLSGCTLLRALIFNNNRIDHIPSWIADLHSLLVLDIKDNPIVSPPLETIDQLQKLVKNGVSWVKELSTYLIKSSPDHKSREVDSTSPLVPHLSESKQKASRRRGLLMVLTSDPARDTDPITPTREANRPSKVITDTVLPPIDQRDLSLMTSLPSIAQTLPSPAAHPYPVGGSSDPTSGNASSSTLPVVGSASSMARTAQRTRYRSNTMREIDRILEKSDSVDTEHKSGAYFRRLLTLQEHPASETPPPPSYSAPSARSKLSADISHPRHQHAAPTPNQKMREDKPASTPARAPVITTGLPPPTKPKRVTPQTLIKVSRKVLFAFSEVHSSVRRFTGFCIDKKVAMRMVSHLYSTKANIDALVENLEAMEDVPNNVDSITLSLTACITSFRLIMDLLRDNIVVFASQTEVCFIRMLYLTLYGALNELQNAFHVLVPPPPIAYIEPRSNDPKQKLAINTKDIYDANLYRAIEVATTDAQTVFGELTRAISKGALDLATTNLAQPAIGPAVAVHVRELTHVCITSMEITNRLRSKVAAISESSTAQDHHSIWDDTNLFLKAIIQTFSNVKAVMKDLPVLNEIRPSMASLTKTTKDVTRMLERQLHKQTLCEAPPPLSAMPSVSNLPMPSSSAFPHPSTPRSGHPLSVSLSSNLSLLANIRSTAAAPGAHPGSTMDPFAAGNMSAPLTAPAHSTGQYFAKNGMNPFDGLIMANSREGLLERERE